VPGWRAAFLEAALADEHPARPRLPAASSFASASAVTLPARFRAAPPPR